MTLEELNVKLANVEGQLAGLQDGQSRIEDQLHKVLQLDRTVAEVVVRQAHTSDAIDHVRKRLDESRVNLEQADTKMSERIDLASMFHGRVTGALYVIVALLGALAGAAGWVLLRVEDNSRMNAVQEMRLQLIEEDLRRMRRTFGPMNQEY